MKNTKPSFAVQFTRLAEAARRPKGALTPKPPVSDAVWTGKRNGARRARSLDQARTFVHALNGVTPEFITGYFYYQKNGSTLAPLCNEFHILFRVEDASVLEYKPTEDFAVSAKKQGRRVQIIVPDSVLEEHPDKLAHRLKTHGLFIAPLKNAEFQNILVRCVKELPHGAAQDYPEVDPSYAMTAGDAPSFDFLVGGLIDQKNVRLFAEIEALRSKIMEKNTIMSEKDKMLKTLSAEVKTYREKKEATQEQKRKQRRSAASRQRLIELKQLKRRLSI